MSTYYLIAYLIKWVIPILDFFRRLPPPKGLDGVARLQPLFCESATGSSLEVMFEFGGTDAVSESHGCFDSPRHKFAGVWNLAPIVTTETLAKVVC